MSEVKAGFARDWVEFFDPNDAETIFKCDLTWLTSYWTCIYGDGCQGVFKNQPNSGCCTEGAMYTDEADEERTLKAAAYLTPEMWRRSFETREYGEREYSVTVIGEYERLAWGDGGDDFDWYCTSNSDAHVGTEPVYISNKYELELLMGKDAYAELARLCDFRMEHIRDSAARSLPLFIIQHPATLAAQKK